ncbi:hypothetical protein HYDPIDRAFT_106664 [Hydnomerulius pinastri MD-312]|nr:hypothetical protein HYDPIDRAFT_106664 [Hydnomerulius pinastri MD-312]
MSRPEPERSSSDLSFTSSSASSFDSTSTLHHRDTWNASASDADVHGTQALSSSDSGELVDVPLAVDSTQELSEAQLRQLYDEEEVERFMYLFSAYVTEVRLPGASASTDSLQATLSADTLSSGVPMGSGRSSPMAPPPLPRRSTDRSLSERIAYKYVLPYLPAAAHTTPPFSIKRLRLTSQRLYLATVPPYQAFLLDLAHLALWKDQQRSTIYCIIFWFLWFHDLLLPALMFRILWCLLRRRLLPYPTLKELHERRQDTARARQFGEEVQERLSAATLGPREMWRLFKFYKASTKDRAKALAKGASKSPEQENTSPASKSAGAKESENEPTALDSGDSQEEQDLKRDLLRLLNELADLHERVKNIFTWRRPAVSRRYAAFLTILSFGVLILPAHYIAKLLYMSGGVVFWHVVPVIAALPKADRARLPPAFGDASTDADYAMDLITKRIAAGQDVGVTASRTGHSHRGSNASTTTVNLTGTSFDTGTNREEQSTNSDGINWKKWGARVAHGKSLIDDGRHLLSGRKSQEQTMPTEGIAPRGPAATEQTHTFPAQYTSVPGLITLTSTTLYFTSLTSTRAKLVIPCSQLRGVKKSGLVKGISVTWVPTDPGDSREREEKFHWVGNRDELFARLLGPDGGRWMRV